MDPYTLRTPLHMKLQEGYGSPAGEIQPGQRAPSGPSGPAGELATPPAPTNRIMAVEHRLYREDNGWRPVSVYVGALASNLTVGVGLCYPPGALVKKVALRLSTTLAQNTSDYWTFGVYWEDTNGDQALLNEEDTSNTKVSAKVPFYLYHSAEGMRLATDQSIVVKFVQTGSPTGLAGVQVQADWFVGVGG